MKFVFFDGDGKVTSAHNDDTLLEVPKGAMKVSDEQWGDRWNLCLVDGQIALTKPEVSAEDLAATLRRERNRLLVKNVDSINPLRLEGMGEDEKAKIRKYREALLNVPEQKGFPFDVDWPVL